MAFSFNIQLLNIITTKKLVFCTVHFKPKLWSDDNLPKVVLNSDSGKANKVYVLHKNSLESDLETGREGLVIPKHCQHGRALKHKNGDQPITPERY